jgi:hypothetical protein
MKGGMIVESINQTIHAETIKAVMSELVAVRDHLSTYNYTALLNCVKAKQAVILGNGSKSGLESLRDEAWDIYRSIIYAGSKNYGSRDLWIRLCDISLAVWLACGDTYQACFEAMEKLYRSDD